MNGTTSILNARATKSRTAKRGDHAPSRDFDKDTAIVGEALQRLQECPHIRFRSIHIEFYDGVLTLRGTVSCFFHKQLVQEVVRRVAGVTFIENGLDVSTQSARLPKPLS